jgi:hypothetical protein
MHLKRVAASLSRLLLGSTIIGLLSVASFGAGRDDVAIDPEIAGPPMQEAGAWRTKTQSVFDPVERMLVRRMYTVWDTAPSRDLDFVWIADSVHDDQPGKVNGPGRLIWRAKGRPSYDRSAIFSEYRGAMKDGRAEGQGSYSDSTGITYAGGWKNGLMEGFGTLMVHGGDEYVGQMRAGKANGNGRYVDVTGEIFEGRFLDGQREGLGTTTLPNGNSYRSRWALGHEAEDSHLVRLAQSTGLLAQGGAADVRIGVTVDKRQARDGDLVYAASGSGPKLMIQPDNKRLVSMWKGGGEIQLLDNEEGGEEYGVFSLTRGQLFPLRLVFEVQNRSSSSISVVGAYLAVGSSVSDLQPAVQLNRNLGQCGGADYQPIFKAENFGWAAAEGATMRFAFMNPNINGRPRTLNVSKGIGSINRTAQINIEPELRAAGVNTAILSARSESGFVCTLRSPAECLQQIKATGIFGSIASQIGLKDTSIFVSAAGTLDYNWRDSKGNQQSQSSPYNVRVPLGHIKIEAECGEGGERDAIAATPLQFRLDQSGYRLPISFQRGIPAGRTSQFTVAVNAPKSSQHDFTVVLQLADGREVSSRPVNLLYYLPSWFASN